MKLLIVISSYLVTDLTIDCLRSISRVIDRLPVARVAVCENGTGDEAAARLRLAIEENGWGSWVDLTVVYPNRGFTGGNNIVIRPALVSDDPPEYVLLLNADTTVQENAIDALVAFMDACPTAGIAGSMLISARGIAGGKPFRFPGIATELDRGLRLGLVSRLLSPRGLTPPRPQGAYRAGWVCLASAILRRTMLEEIGLLDEGLYTYFDDVDLCLRAQRAGWETWFVPESQVTHIGAASTGVYDQMRSRRPAYWYQARRRYFLKNYGAWYTAVVDLAFISGFSLWRVRRRLQHKPDTDPPHTLIDSIRHSVFCTGFKLREVENPAKSAGAAHQG